MRFIYFKILRFIGVRLMVIASSFWLFLGGLSVMADDTMFVPGRDDPEAVYERVRESINFGREDRFEIIDAAEVFANAIGDEKLKNRILRSKSVNSIISGDTESGLKFATTALAEARLANLAKEEEVHALNMLGQAKSANGDTLGALQCYQNASSLAKSLGAAKEIFQSGIMESNLYIKLQKIEQALEVMEWMEDYYDAYEDEAHRLIYAHNYADCLFSKEQYEEVVRFIDKRVGYGNTEGDVLRISIRLLYLMSVLESDSEWDESRGAFNSQVEAIEVSLQNESESRALFICWSFLARTWYLMNEFDLAEGAAAKARGMTDDLRENQMLSNLLEMEAKIAKKQGKFELALEKTESLLELDKEIRNESLLRQIEILRVQHKDALKNAEIEQLNLENRLQQKLINTHKQRVFASLLLVLLLLIIGVLGLVLYQIQSRHLRLEKLRAEDALKVNAKLREAEANKDYFLAVASHELRNPLSGIIGMLCLMDTEGMDSEMKEMIGLMRESANGMLEQINEILDYSKAEAGKLEIVDKEFDVRVLSSSVLNLWRGKAQSGKLELSFEVVPDVPEILIGDPYRIRQVLSNLISNAIKFTHEGGVHLRVFCERNNYVYDVRDTGIGLSESEMSTLFQPYQQANPETNRKYGGTGLGLSICRSLAEAMHGTIEVRSEQGKGSHFSLRLPLRVPQKTG